MRIRSALFLSLFIFFYMYPLFFCCLLDPLSTEYNVTVMLSFKGRRVIYIYIYKYFFFFLFHLKVVCTKSTNCIVDSNIIFFFFSLVQSFLMVCCTVRSLLELMRAVFEKTVCMMMMMMIKLFFSFLSFSFVRSFNCLTLSFFFCVCVKII
jgi:hypothetical protein